MLETLTMLRDETYVSGPEQVAAAKKERSPETAVVEEAVYDKNGKMIKGPKMQGKLDDNSVTGRLNRARDTLISDPLQNLQDVFWDDPFAQGRRVLDEEGANQERARAAAESYDLPNLEYFVKNLEENKWNDMDVVDVSGEKVGGLQEVMQNEEQAIQLAAGELLVRGVEGEAKKQTDEQFEGRDVNISEYTEDQRGMTYINQLGDKTAGDLLSGDGGPRVTVELSPTAKALNEKLFVMSASETVGDGNDSMNVFNSSNRGPGRRNDTPAD